MDIRLPERTQPEHDSFPTGWWGLRRWLRAFAEARPGERLKQLDSGLDEVHRLALPPHTRMRVLRALMPVARGLLDELARRIGGQSLPLPSTSRKTLDTNLRLLERLARGFDAVVADESAGARPHIKRVATAAQAALALRGELLLRCAQVYMPPPKAYWHAVHAVFAATERAGAAQVRVRPIEGERQRISPGDEFVRILVLAVARTESLRRGQIWPLYKALGEWAPRMELNRELPADSISVDLITVDLAQTEPPAFRQRSGVEQHETLRVVSVQPVVAALDALLERAAAEESAIADPDTLRRQTVRQLLGTFRQDAVRGSKRQAVGAPVEVEVGLRNIQARLAFVFDDPGESEPEESSGHHRVQGTASQLALQTIEEDVPPPELGFVTHPGHDQLRDAAHSWEAASNRRPSATGPDGTEAASGHIPSAEGEWRLEDSSRGGFRLNWESDQPSRATVGELIAVAESDSGGDAPAWHIGVIRWLQFIDERRFQLGAERLPGRPRPGTIRREPRNPNRKRNRELEHAEPALFMPGNRQKEKPATILVPAHMFKLDEIVEIDVGERTLRVRLAEAMEQTNSFIRFGIRAAPRRQLAPERREDDRAPIWGDP